MVKNRLKEILDERGIKQSWLAKRCHLQRATISNIVNDRFSTSLDAAFLIALALNLDITDIFYWTDEDHEYDFD